jgi:hypothetical protein
VTSWPALPLDEWRDTRDTLQMWTQIAGKVCLALTPRVNHFWNIALHFTARGLVTPPLPVGGRTFTMTFDFVAHELVIQVSDGRRETVALRPQTVADFYRTVVDTLGRLGIEVPIWPMPVEVPEPIRFDRDTTHHSYDADAARRCWEVLLAITPVFQAFRAEFIGKCSPVHFFWGSFDLAVTRFSGRSAPPHPGGIPALPDDVTREAYSHEVSSAGFWPGGGPIDYPAFYSYAYPAPNGFAEARVEPAAAHYDTSLGEFLLPYDAVRRAHDPEATLMTFLESTYHVAADHSGWDRQALECPFGEPRRPRRL